MAKDVILLGWGRRVLRGIDGLRRGNRDVLLEIPIVQRARAALGILVFLAPGGLEPSLVGHLFCQPRQDIIDKLRGFNRSDITIKTA